MDARVVKQLLMSAGACAAGIAEAAPVDASVTSAYGEWLAHGCHASMIYLEKYADLRSDPRLLLEGARSVIVAAFNYYTPRNEGAGGLKWARYALGRDYHEVVRERLAEVAGAITVATGAVCRVCVDTAPVHERYWAMKAGVGFTGLNNLLIVPGVGSWCVLGEILTALPLATDVPCDASCDGCGRCVAACPGHALDGKGGLDARRCMSYLTIESRQEHASWPTTSRVYGCDICQEVCPHNRMATPSELQDFAPRDSILALSADDIAMMPQERFSAIFTHSAIKRAKLSGLRRNIP